MIENNDSLFFDEDVSSFDALNSYFVPRDEKERFSVQPFFL